MDFLVELSFLVLDVDLEELLEEDFELSVEGALCEELLEFSVEGVVACCLDFWD